MANTLHGAHDQVPNPHKMKQLALYIATKSEQDPSFGKVKLNKLLFYSEFFHYMKTGRSITGFSYIKMDYGPCPKGFHTIQAEMDEADQLKMQHTMRYQNFEQMRPIALVIPDLAEFTGEEIASVDGMIDTLSELNGSEVSALSHLFLGWRHSKNFEEIPYSVVRLSLTQEFTPYRQEIVAQAAHRAAERMHARG